MIKIADISENQVEEYLNQMIKLNLIFNKKTNQGLHSFYKTTGKNEEIPLDLSYLTESKPFKYWRREFSIRPL